MKKLLMLCLITLATNLAFAQVDKLVGVWELTIPPTPNGERPAYNVLRTFDEKGNYIQIAATPNGSFIVGKAHFAEFVDGKVKENIKFAADSSRIGKTFNFSYKFITEGKHQLLITEGGTKVEAGYATVEWREIWRKVEEYKQ